MTSKKKNGREAADVLPGKWKPQVCEDLLAHSRQGLSFAAFAGVAGVSRKTLYKWLDKHPDFRAAKDLADGLHLLAWEKIGVGLATGKLKGSGVAFIHQICNRFPDLYRQRIETKMDLSNEDGSLRPTVIRLVAPDLKNE